MWREPMLGELSSQRLYWTQFRKLWRLVIFYLEASSGGWGSVDYIESAIVFLNQNTCSILLLPYVWLAIGNSNITICNRYNGSFVAKCMDQRWSAALWQSRCFLESQATVDLSNFSVTKLKISVVLMGAQLSR